MSHSVTIVLFPKSIEADAIEAFLATALAPYSERLEVPEYPHDCYCLGREVAAEMRAFVREQCGDIDIDREAYHALPEEQRTDEEWQRRIQPRYDAENIFKARDGSKERFCRPEADCDDCKGTGTYPSTYNPQSKWDWYQIGGRWAGWIQGDEQDFTTNRDADCSIQSNSIQAETLKKAMHRDPDRVPFAILDLAGTWHQRGQMLMFGMVADEKGKPTWQETCVELLDKVGDCWAIAVDVHI